MVGLRRGGLALLVLTLSACGARESGGTGSIALQSPSFPHGGKIPKRHAKEGEGENVSPALSWSGVPQGTKEFAVIVDDPTAEGPSPWVQWVVYGIPATAKGLPEGVPPDPPILADPAGAMQGKNSWGTIGYAGPFPAPGKAHTYQFWVYALDTRLPLGVGATKENVMDALRGHVLGSGRIVGTYSR